MLVTLREMGEISFHLIGSNGFYENTQNEMFISVGLHCPRILKFENFMSPFDRLRQINVLKCVRAARLVFIIQPIILICGVDVVVAVVVIVSND